MTFFRNIKSLLYKILTGYGFYICIIFTTVLSFSAEIYIDFVNGNKYSVFNALMSFDRDYMLRNTVFCSTEVMLKGSASWLSLFIPIVASFSFVPLMCDEYEAKAIRFEVFRSSKACYHSSKFITACLSGGLAIMLGYGLFMWIAYLLFPDISEYESGMQELYREMLMYRFPDLTESGFTIIVVQKLASMFMYGAVCCAPVIMLTIIIRNKYLVMCIPFFIKYALNQTCIKLQTQATADYNNMDMELLQNVGIVNPDALARLSEYGANKKSVLIYRGIIIAISFVVYLIVSLRKVDSGE
ncbi:MAG: hypothetical protein J6A30_04030 [Ruminococcus sp.]|nr:hypothetical protein [Ruminococcus sp.]